jgi:hypothetical protein
MRATGCPAKTRWYDTSIYVRSASRSFEFDNTSEARKFISHFDVQCNRHLAKPFSFEIELPYWAVGKIPPKAEDTNATKAEAPGLL